MNTTTTYGAQAIAEDLENLGEEIATDTEMTLGETKPQDFDHISQALPLPKADKERLLKLTPANYTGIAAKLATLA